MTSPRIVVGMGVYNEEQYLGETIPAVLAQTMPDFQFVILDNGSTDKSWELLGRLTSTDPRVTLLRSPRNMPPAEAANFGFTWEMNRWPECRWFIAQGADDLMAADYLAAILAAADKHRDVNCIFSPWQWIGHPKKGVKKFPPYNPMTVHRELQIPGWRAFTRELWDAVGPENTTCGLGSDWEWVVRATVKAVLRPYQLDRPYLSLRVREGRKSQSELGDWPTMHAHLCDLMNQRPPGWASRVRIPRANARPQRR